MKILRRGSLSINDGSPWTPGVWREAPDAKPGGPCAQFPGDGLHTLKGNDPLRAPVFAWPCEVWLDECEGLLGEDEGKARYRRQRIYREVTHEYPVIARVHAVIEEMRAAPYLRPDDAVPVPAWMRVEQMSMAAAWDAAWAAARAAAVAAAVAAAWAAAVAAAWDAAVAAARAAAGAAAWAAARAAAVAAAWAAARAAAGDAARAAAGDAARAAAGDAARAAAGDAAGAAYSALISDLPVDTTWLRRWWEAWRLGYYPIREEGDTLVVARVTDGGTK